MIGKNKREDFLGTLDNYGGEQYSLFRHFCELVGYLNEIFRAAEPFLENERDSEGKMTILWGAYS